MVERAEVLTMLGNGASYEEVALMTGLPPGQVYLVATGLPADGSVCTIPPGSEPEGMVRGSTQHLVNPRMESPTRKAPVDDWLLRRVQADEPMLRAAAERDAEPPPVEHAENTDDVISVLGWDHSQVKYLLKQLQTIPGAAHGTEVHHQRRASIVDMVRVRLSEHEVVEEEYFWPAVRSALPEGSSLADHALMQEQEGKDLLHALGGTSPGEVHFDQGVEELVGAIRRHVAFEDAVFLQFAERVGDEGRAELGRKVKEAKKRAPTRPHPHAPDRPPLNRIAAAAAAPLDHARDALSHRPAKRRGKAAAQHDPGAAE